VSEERAEADSRRVRTVRWRDPRAFVAAARSMSGLEILRAIGNGSLPPPPFADLLEVRFATVEPSRVVFEMDPAEYMYSPLQTVHGGILTTLLDSAMGCALHTTLPAGVSYTTLELNVNFVRPVTDATGTVAAEAKVVSAGRTVATVEARLTDRSGKLYAHATSTLMILRPKTG
jgi:uncharacterized protein (TIGR00369 family)